MKALLISVHGKYCDKYANRTKTIEVRKQLPKQDFNDIVYIYNTQTKQIEFKGVLIGVFKLDLKTIESNFIQNTGLSLRDLNLYAGQKNALVLLDFFHVTKLNNPISMNEMIKAGIMPPQGYKYIQTETFNLN